MLKWKSTIDLTKVWRMFGQGQINLTDLVQEIAKAFEANTQYNQDPYMWDIVNEMKHLGNDDIEQFDILWDDIYDLADLGNRIWIRTT